jgi:hypothetical protein
MIEVALVVLDDERQFLITKLGGATYPAQVDPKL